MISEKTTQSVIPSFFQQSNATKFFLGERPYVPTSDGVKLMM